MRQVRYFDFPNKKRKLPSKLQKSGLVKAAQLATVDAFERHIADRFHCLDPNQQMTGLIWFGRFSEYFSYKPEKFLKRKSVCVKGYISEHEGKTQMEIRTEKQIKIRE